MLIFKNLKCVNKNSFWLESQAWLPFSYMNPEDTLFLLATAHFLVLRPSLGICELPHVGQQTPF